MMTTNTLTLRLSRRAIGAVTLQGDSLAFTDGRHLTSRSERATAAGTAYLRKLLELLRPSVLVFDAPTDPKSPVVSGLIGAIEQLAAEYRFEVVRVNKPELLMAYGRRPVRSRRELRTLVRSFWPQLSQIKGRVEPYITDAAAAALHAQCRLELERRVT